MNVYLLAHGNQERLPIPLLKQFIEVGVEKIISRTVRLLSERGFKDPVVVAPDTPEWSGFCSGLGLRRQGLEEPLPDIVGSIGRIVREPGDHLFLLADVVFSKKAMDIALSPSSIWSYYGKPGNNFWTGKSYGEIYALLIPDGFRDPVVRFSELQHGLKRTVSFMKRWVDIPLTVIDDWTDDIDSEVDFQYVLPKLDAFVRAEA